MSDETPREKAFRWVKRWCDECLPVVQFGQRCRIETCLALTSCPFLSEEERKMTENYEQGRGDHERAQG